MCCTLIPNPPLQLCIYTLGQLLLLLQLPVVQTIDLQHTKITIMLPHPSQEVINGAKEAPPPPHKAFSLTSADLLRASGSDPESVFQGSSQRSLAYCRGRAPSGERPFCTCDVMPRNSPRYVRSCARKRIYTVGGNMRKQI